jgi:peroxiredoxin
LQYRRRLPPLVAWFLVFFLVVGCVSCGPTRTPAAAPSPTTVASPTRSPTYSPSVGGLAPEFTLERLEGGTLTLSQLRGKVVLVNFFATWCPYCQAEMHFLQEAWESQQDQGVEVVIVDIQETLESVGDFMRQNGYTMPVVLDREGQAAVSYRVISLPTSYILDREGVIRAVDVGAYSSEEAVLSRLAKIE